MVEKTRLDVRFTRSICSFSEHVEKSFYPDWLFILHKSAPSFVYVKVCVLSCGVVTNQFLCGYLMSHRGSIRPIEFGPSRDLLSWFGLPFALNLSNISCARGERISESISYASGHKPRDGSSFFCWKYVENTGIRPAAHTVRWTILNSVYVVVVLWFIPRFPRFPELGDYLSFARAKSHAAPALY